MTDELVERIAEITADELKHHINKELELTCSPIYFGEHIAPNIKQAILSDPSICEIEVGAELPENPNSEAWDYLQHFGVEQYRKLLAGWVKKKDGV